MNFMEAMKTENNQRKTFTENGAVAYETAGKALTDFVFATTAFRNESEEAIQKEFAKVYFENSMDASKLAFWERDCRGGNGERRLFRVCLKWLAKNKPEVAKAVIKLVPEYGRFDDLWCLLDTSIKKEVCAFVKEQIEDDMEKSIVGKPISLLAKWLPSINTSSSETRHYAEILRNYLGLTPRQYRKTLARMRQYLDVVEVKTSANRWNEINYESVPSQANIKYTDSFMRHDLERRTEYLESLKKGDTKIIASVLQPHEIVSKYTGYFGDVHEYDEALEQLWKALPAKSLDNTLVVRDGSGSMTGGYNTKIKPLDVATGLAVYMADHNHGCWKDKWITFSSNPKIIDQSGCENIHDKFVLAYDEAECSNTDIEKTMMLILNTAINNHCSQEDMPKNIVIVSDMGFDVGTRQVIRSTYGFGNFTSVDVTKSLFDDIADAYKEAGYQLPRIIFWNVAGEMKNGIPMQQNELGVILISGFSVQLLDMVMSGETNPYKAILETINSLRYQAVEDAIKDII